MNKTTFTVAKQFSPSPGGRYASMDENSGEAFRSILVNLLSEYEEIDLILDGTEGYPPSFLEEAFGGLVRDGFRSDEIIRRIHLIATTPSFRIYPKIIQKYISEAK